MNERKEAGLLEVRDLVVRYGQAQVLHSLDLHVGEREIVAVVGANGAGKTTLLRTISGLVRASSGAIRFADQDIANSPAHLISRQGIAHIPEGRGMLPTLSVADNLRMGAYPDAPDAKLMAQLRQWFPVLEARAHQPAGLLSGGEQQMLAISRAVLGKPRLILIDEMSLGLSPKVTSELVPRLQDLRAAGASILLVDQNTQQALRVADRVYVLSNGRIVFCGAPAQLKDQPDMMSRYLGVD